MDDPAAGASGGRSADQLASIGQRVGARLIDWALLFMASFAVITPFENKRVGFLCWMLLIALYETLLVSRFGQTIGKRVVNIKIVDSKSGGAVSIVRAFLRVAPVLTVVALIPGQLFPAVLVFLYFTAAFSKDDYRGLLDRLARTAVVKRV